MNEQEKLYAAIGGTSPELVARSEKRRRNTWRRYCLAAACLALALTLGWILSSRTGPDVTPPDSGNPGLKGEQLFLPEQGSEIGVLRLLSFVPQSQEEKVDFLIYVNEEQYSIYEENGLYSIRSKDSPPDNFPECGLDIIHLSSTSSDQARTDAEEALKGRYTTVSSEEESSALPGSLYLRASAGAEWDSEQTELWFVDDKQGGTFILTSRYFLEAEEGMGMRFRDMASSFRAVSPDETVPEWMRTLYETTGRLLPALLSNDLSDVADLLAENVEANTYGQDVWKDLTVASIDYTLENDHDPTSAAVIVKHRLNLEEGEGFHYLTMELTRQNSQWQLTWSGIQE